MSTPMRSLVTHHFHSLTIEVRKWKRAKEFGEAQWEFEIGEAQKSFNPEADLLAPSGENVNSFSDSFILNDSQFS